MMHRTHIVIFAKAPAPGLAKTRLIPALGAVGAARLASALLQQTLHTAIAGQPDQIRLWTTPHWQDPLWAEVSFTPFFEKTHFQIAAQRGADLGERMWLAAHTSLQETEKVLFIGTDCPALTPMLLQQASLALNDCDAIMIPSTDGGYVLLGLKQADETLFSQMPWSTAEVGRLTQERCEKLGWQCVSLPPLTDIDEPKDLQAYPGIELMIR
jgi:rSAM/selenodomain-associated transferase 1